MGFPQHLISMIASLDHNQKATIRWNNANCEPFNIEKGVRQGCVLSPHLLNLYTEQIMRQADIDDMGINIGSRDNKPQICRRHSTHQPHQHEKDITQSQQCRSASWTPTECQKDKGYIYAYLYQQAKSLVI
ncbi:hypothetical protein ElyMa_006772900 [Elysia marginata]|uniref:Reverse transcriptase domain-containing protein n=1 Tax=Elysia marginata TaxID=1093978 RepID=A0AAV4IYM0_9GAST|nr:hypothetical protein ElyMa_006772900 [Elysia marginata]